ncbi:hypothetical protein KO507_11985 [Gilvimarinus agarilyticus]|uniref:hypothetical protein n=1 Tax=Gilvimarinus sp. 2_MG-2023 TaxID=3062666 RepID=UPI001C083223|nr:hypothetical protein [Gilvimarinus sp. 2_MG-2023]MBU2886484.1 hypothetical protein [Gilvimarinus agarilyticus]MDO6571163.1 hypothetical protein [Gilvimarinus sp. 2_MG-2023]
MLKKFLSGIVFGAGFSIAALGIYTAWMLYVFPPLVYKSFTSEPVVTEGSAQFQPIIDTPNFHELSVDEKIDLATAIIVVKFEDGDNDHYKSVVEDILKKEEGVELYYNLGEVYEENTHYKMSDEFVPTRAIVFLQGNPATMRFSTTFNGDRIRGLGGISLALLKEKCNNN